MFIVEEANNLFNLLILGGGWDMNEVDKPYLQSDVAVLDVTFHIFLLFTCYTSDV